MRKMKEEAKYRALSSYFKEVYGLTKANDFKADQICRPLTL